MDYIKQKCKVMYNCRKYTYIHIEALSSKFNTFSRTLATYINKNIIFKHNK